MTKRTILFQAAPFCFGPVSTTLNVMQELAGAGHRLIMVDEGPTGDLIRRSGLPIEGVALPTTPPFTPELGRWVDRVDLVVSNTDPIFAAACMERGAPVTVIDTLFWMWDHIPPILMEAELFISQAFHGTQAQIERLGRPRNYIEVGPLIAPQALPVPLADRDRLIQVSFGGCDCFLVDPAHDPYPALVLGLLEEALDAALPADHRVVLCCGERTACTLEPRDGRITVNTLSNREYLRTMRRARAIFLSPGLAGTMEVFEAQTPAFFFPPQNYSQVLQLRACRQAAVAPYSFTWSDVYPEFDLPPYLREEEAVARVRQVIERAVDDPVARDELRRQMVSFLQVGIHDHNPGPPHRLRESLGMGGPSQAARAIESWLGSH
jgi:hypothetical protein